MENFGFGEGMLIIKFLISAITALFGKNKLAILTYHRVGSSSNAVAMDAARFEQHLIWIKRYFSPVSLPDGLALQKKGLLPRGAVALTIDDGYIDSYSTIFPLLKKYELTATFFISTIGYETGYLWDEKIASIIMTTKRKKITFDNQEYPLLTEEEKVSCLTDCLSKIKYMTIVERDEIIKKLDNYSVEINSIEQFLTEKQTLELYESGMGVGAHTHTHPILMKENAQVALDEIKQSKEILEGIIHRPIEYFAYPNGKFGIDFDISHIQMVEDLGFLAAFSTDKGVLKDTKIDGFQIKRFTPWDETEFGFSLRLALNYRK